MTALLSLNHTLLLSSDTHNSYSSHTHPCLVYAMLLMITFVYIRVHSRANEEYMTCISQYFYRIKFNLHNHVSLDYLEKYVSQIYTQLLQ